MSARVVFLVVDALNLIRRVHSVNPDDALTRTTQSLRRALGDARPTHAVAVFDGAGPTWRHDLYDEYKAGRAPMPTELRSALDDYRRAFAEMSVASVHRDNLEADDVAATLAVKASSSSAEAVILSTDQVYCQLLSTSLRVRDHFRREEWDRAAVVAKFGVTPDKLVDLWALAGSSSTHIPGVKGIGPKTAVRLLDEHGGLEDVLAAASDGRIGGRTGALLVERAELARLSRTLSGLRTDIELGWNLKSFRCDPPR